MLRNGCSFAQDHAKMPSLFKYFTIAGAVLFWLLTLVNSVLDPSGPKPSVATATPTVIVKHDPRASLVERLRAEEAVQKAAADGNTIAPRAEPVVPVTQPAEPVTLAQAEPVQVSGPAAVTNATPTEDAAARLAQKKIKAERVRKQRLARERARALEQAASRQQDQLHYGYAPQPTFGPFGGSGQTQRW
jgi:hypothetical protein